MFHQFLTFQPENLQLIVWSWNKIDTQQNWSPTFSTAASKHISGTMVTMPSPKALLNLKKADVQAPPSMGSHRSLDKYSSTSRPQSPYSSSKTFEIAADKSWSPWHVEVHATVVQVLQKTVPFYYKYHHLVAKTRNCYCSTSVVPGFIPSAILPVQPAEWARLQPVRALLPPKTFQIKAEHHKQKDVYAIYILLYILLCFLSFSMTLWTKQKNSC